MFNFYENQDKGFPGMKANSTVDTVDSFASEGGVNPGEAVFRGTDVEKQVKAVAVAADLAKVIGIAVHTHKDPNETGKYYEEGYSVPVMTSGDVFVEAGGDVVAGGGVAILIDGDGPHFVAVGSTATVGGETVTATTISSMTYMTSGSEGDMVVVRIRK